MRTFLTIAALKNAQFVYMLHSKAIVLRAGFVCPTGLQSFSIPIKFQYTRDEMKIDVIFKNYRMVMSAQFNRFALYYKVLQHFKTKYFAKLFLIKLLKPLSDCSAKQFNLAFNVPSLH